MNYIDEDKAFEQWCENNYLPILSQAIWKKLFKRFNRSGWSEWVTVDNLTLMAEVQIRREASFIEYRDKLIEMGLIKYIKGKKGCPNQYKLISHSNMPVQNAVQSVVEPVVQSVVESVVQTADITKHKQNKDKTKRNAFIAPSLDEVKAYCLERKNKVDPNYFYDYFKTSNWVDSRGNKVMNWKQKIITWEKNNINKSEPSKQAKAGNSFLNLIESGSLNE